ncbi:DUF7511 domain-containing protein [Natronorubrum sulfidifaciens]|uniref:DUF7511 domain-containing protein n=1 Tax=Natronorubrum sulfidifaciens JCM 14089 TaxID=1230460 RepID=L9W7K0_9EURY|nr:hypothetical protein [Natronorubrum sulfidifaciens]ELY44313.1 hypothetical protein C495_10439 [Natronorubrum sulfidifaciens JCM 14089]
MNTDADSFPRTDEPAIELDHATIENENAPDECAIFPREATEDELMTHWITAHDESFVSLESMR